MALTQAEAETAWAWVEAHAAHLLGVPPKNFPVHVLTREAFDAMASSANVDNPQALTSGGQVYVPDDTPAADLKGRLSFEAANAYLSTPGTGGDTAQTMAFAQTLRIKMGLAQDDGSSPLITQLLNLPPKDWHTAVDQQSNGTFQGVQNLGYPTARNPNTQGAPDTGSAQPGDITYPVGAWTFTLHTDGTVSAGPTGGKMTDYADAATASAAYAAAPTPRTQLQIANATAAFQSVAQGLGLDPSTLGSLIGHAAEKGWTTARFNMALQSTPEFHAAFPGIFDLSGNLRMSPTQYLATQRSYQANASQYGINLNPKTEAWLFQNEVSPDEFAQRASAVNKLQTNQQYFQAFNETLKSQGKEPLSRGDQLRFVMGQGNHEWYKEWQNASTRYASEQAGVQVGKVGATGDQYTTVGEGLLSKLAAKGLSEADMSSGFQQLGEHLLTTLPLSRLQHYNLSKKDIATGVFGGEGQAEVRQLMLHVAKQEQAFYQPRSTVALQGSPQGGIMTAGKEQRGQGS